MCLDDVKLKSHQCLNDCPVCYIFSFENLARLLRGSSIQLGAVDHFVEVAQLGCRLCIMLSKAWSFDKEVFQKGAQISVMRQDDAPAGLMVALLFEIREPFDTDFGRYGWHKEKKFHSWTVPFGVYTKGSELLDDHIPIHAPKTSVQHDDMFSAIKTDLADCRANHEQCKKSAGPQQPSRLIMVDDIITEMVFLHHSQANEVVDYVALSYCWGTTAQLRLLSSNFNDLLQNGIQVSSLPKTITDAILVTRKLGMQYLWIDSLCIIQDSNEDKDKELMKMASIYKNATITISAAAAADSGYGFLQDRDQVQLRLDKSMCLPFWRETEEGYRGVAGWIYLCPEAHIGHKVERFSGEIINTRAWTYQESTLAPRLLIYGSGPPQWHCAGKWRIYGLDIHPDCLPNPNSYTSVTKIVEEYGIIVPDQTLKFSDRKPYEHEDIGNRLDWLPLVENYSCRQLSFQADKLLALSALAAEHQAVEHGRYIAGLWEASLPRSLLWWRSTPSESIELTNERKLMHEYNWLRTRIYDDTSNMSGKLRSFARTLASSWSRRLHKPSSSKQAELSSMSAQYIAPTWSPMSSKQPILFLPTATQAEDTYHTTLATIHTIHIDLTSPLNPHGQLNFSYLDITAPMCCIPWKLLTANFVFVTSGEPFAYWDCIVADEPDYFEEIRKKWKQSLCMQAMADRNVQHPIDEGESSIRVTGAGARSRRPVVPEPADPHCRESEEPFKLVGDVKAAIADVLNGNTPLPKENGEPDFWLLEIERSMSPAGLVLKRVDGDIFARVGCFGMNRNLDPEVVLVQGHQFRGRRTWNWNSMLERKRIYLI